jgi:hypothetical protein
MLVYRPTKAMCWGHALLLGNAGEAKLEHVFEGFLDLFFETLESTPGSKYLVRWKKEVIPNDAWPDGHGTMDLLLSPDTLFLIHGMRVSFPMGLNIPLSPESPSTYAFIGSFCASAPFKMSPDHFSVFVRHGKNGKWVLRKPDAFTDTSLRAVLS